MPVRRYRDVSEMPSSAYVDKNDPRLFERIDALLRFSTRLTGELPIPRGVFKFRNMDELNAHRLEWDRHRIQVLQERRRSKARPM
ncbi:MAG TPA: hypothetical protein VGO93_16695 [Candidatus Xenobia bacterium]|jgi:hypothetical protein